MSKKNYLFYLDHFIAQLPGIACWKDTNFVIRASNLALTNICGKRDIKDLNGLTDFEVPCPASEFAETFRAQDQIALSHHHYESVDCITYANNEKKFFHSIKTVLRNPDNQIIGILAVGQAVSDQLLKATWNLMDKVPKKHTSLEILDSDLLHHNNKNYTRTPLSRREHEVLFLLLRGQNSRDIANRLFLSIRTIETYMEQLRNKFTCSSKSELMDAAFHQGYQFIIPKSLL